MAVLWAALLSGCATASPEDVHAQDAPVFLPRARASDSESDVRLSLSGPIVGVHVSF